MAAVPQAKPPTKASDLTTLKLGEVKVSIGVYKATSDPGRLVKFDTAGPHGGVLEARAAVAAVPVEEQAGTTAVSDPLGDGEVKGGLFAVTEPEPTPTAVVPGEYVQQLYEEGYPETPVGPAEVRRGVRLEDGRFVDCTEQLADIDERTQLDGIEILGFAPIASLPRARVIGSYYVGAADEYAPLPLRLIMEALKAERRCGIVKWTKRSRQSLAVLGWHEKSLMLYEIAWAECFRPPPRQATVIMQAAHTQGMIEEARTLVREMNVRASALDELRDDAVALREELREQALTGEVPEVLEPDPVADAMPDVMAQIERTLAAARAA